MTENHMLQANYRIKKACPSSAQKQQVEFENHKYLNQL